MSSQEKPRRIVVGRRVYLEGSEEHKRYLESQKKPEAVIEPEKNNRIGSGKDAGKS